MKIMHYSDAEVRNYNSGQVKGVAGRVVIGKADGADKFCMRVFELEKDGFTPEHAHQWEHEIFVHSGKGQVLYGNEWKDLIPGTILFIPGNEEHQIRNASDEKFIFACLIPAGPPEL